MKCSTDFEGAAAQQLEANPDGSISFSIPPDSGGPEYLWFSFRVTLAKPSPLEFIVENASGAHQTGRRWKITRPVFSTDGSTWIRVEDCNYNDVFGIARLLGRKPVFRFRAPIIADTLWVAYCYPYASAELQRFFSSIQSDSGVQLSSLGKSEEGRDIPKVQIKSCDSLASNPPSEIWIICREHPGETPASYVCEGMISALSQHSAGQRLVDHFLFNIVPMLNVDGVAQGSYYRNAKGINLALDWGDFKSLEVRTLHEALRTSLENGRVRLVVNLHSSNDPSKGHFFLEIPENRLKSPLRELQLQLLQAADGNHPQIQAKSTVQLLPDQGITGNYLNDQYGVYCLYLESNYSLGADGTVVTPESLREVGVALVQALAEVFVPE